MITWVISWILYILIDITSSQCTAPWCYENAYMTVCHEVVECGLVNDINSKSSKCSWYSNGVAVRPGMFNTYCNACSAGTYQKCSFNLPDDGSSFSLWVDAQICNNDEKQTCFVECGQEVCMKRYDSSTGKIFYKTGRTVSSCPQNHPVNNNQCCTFRNWDYCTCLKRPTVDVSDEVYDDLGQSNNFVDIWYGSCGNSEYHATDDYSIKLINENGLSQYYYAIATRPYNPNFDVTYVKAKSANSNYYYKCDQQSYDTQVWKCSDLKNAVGTITGPISLEIYTSYTDNGGQSYRYIIKENVISLTSNAVALVDLYSDGGSAFTQDDLDESQVNEQATEGSLTISEIIVIILAVLLVLIGSIGIAVYCVYKKKKNKVAVSFDDETVNDETNDEIDDAKKDIIKTDGYDMSPINTNTDQQLE